MNLNVKIKSPKISLCIAKDLYVNFPVLFYPRATEFAADNFEDTHFLTYCTKTMFNYVCNTIKTFRYDNCYNN